jgi:hypothetical protein
MDTVVSVIGVEVVRLEFAKAGRIPVADRLFPIGHVAESGHVQVAATATLNSWEAARQAFFVGALHD